MRTRVSVLALLLVTALSNLACAADRSTVNPAAPLSKRATAMKMRLRVGDKILAASFIHNETTRDFISLLPLTLTMNDLFKREKSGDLPRPISEGGQRTRTYAVGDVIYWSPSAHLAIYYRHDAESIPSPGIIVIGKVDSGLDALNVPGPVVVTIELMERQQ